MDTSCFTVRPVENRDAVGLAKANKALNSPHAPANHDAVAKTIALSRASFNGSIVPRQLNLVAEMMDKYGNSVIVGGGALVKMGADGEFPILWRHEPDGSLLRFRYTVPTIEFGGASVTPEMQGKGIGKLLTVARAIIARKCARLFGIKNVLSDFLPPLDDINTKVNIFWDGLIVPILREAGTLDEVICYCERKTGQHIANTTQLSAVIGNTLSDADRNAMVSRFFPAVIPPEKISPDIRAIMGNVNGSTKAAYVNLQKIYGEAFRIIGAFPINGGPNYTAEAAHGPDFEGPLPLMVTTDRDETVATGNDQQVLVFRPLEESLESVMAFRGYAVSACMEEERLTVSPATAELMHMQNGENVVYFPLKSSPSLAQTPDRNHNVKDSSA